MADNSGPSGSEKKNENGNGLVLYQFFPSYFCQKVVFALHEKKLKFKSHTVDLFQGEQFEPWFLKLNPKCEVPVLKDGVKIIPDSRRIIDYVEDNFSNGDTPRLIPEKGSPQYQTMERMRDLLDNIPNALITFGCLIHPELTGEIKLPPQEIKARRVLPPEGFVHKHALNQLYVYKATVNAYFSPLRCLKGEKEQHRDILLKDVDFDDYAVFYAKSSILNDYAEKYKEYQDHYLVKKNLKEKLFASIADKNEVEKGLLDVVYALKESEKLLASQEKDGKTGWLCGEKFTIADISLCVLLSRLNVLGLLEKYFVDNNFKQLPDYFKRAQQREAFKRTMNQSSSLLKSFSSMNTKDQFLVTIGSVAVILGAVGIATFLIHRNK